MVGISKLPGWDEPIKLSSNESVLGMSPAAIEAAQQAVGSSHLYPEVDTEALAEALAERYRLETRRMAFGPGSDEVLQRVVNTFAGPGQELVHSKNAYMQFPIYAKVAGATPIAADDRDFHYDVDSILSKMTEKLVSFCSRIQITHRVPISLEPRCVVCTPDWPIMCY